MTSGCEDMKSVLKKSKTESSFHVFMFIQEAPSSLGNPDHLQVVSDPAGKNYIAVGGGGIRGNITDSWINNKYMNGKSIFKLISS